MSLSVGSFAVGILAGLGALVVLPRVFGFKAQKSAQYAGMTPEFDVKTVLNGKMICEGVIYGPLGRVTSRFIATMEATWQGNHCSVAETFIYDNGNKHDRVWDLVLEADGSIRARATDIIGDGVGQQDGPAVGLRYRIKLPEHSGGHELNAVDWMYLLENGTIINRSQFSKFGIKVAELVATIRQA